MENQKIENSREKSQIIRPERAMMIPPKTVEKLLQEPHGIATKDMNKTQQTTQQLHSPIVRYDDGLQKVANGFTNLKKG
jgi:hypothetical protein